MYYETTKLGVHLRIAAFLNETGKVRATLDVYGVGFTVFFDVKDLKRAIEHRLGFHAQGLRDALDDFYEERNEAADRYDGSLS